MANVSVNQLCKQFGQVTAVNNLSLEVKDREFMVLVGPSGCGKTTALRMIAGLEEVSSGSIFIGEKDVTNIEPRDRDIAMVFQNYALYPHMSVYENMAFGLRLRKTPNAEITRRVNDAAKLLSIEAFLKRKPGQLSGGQRQRVALGRAIVREPQVFLMDEPLSNLDAKLRVQTRAELIKLHRRLGITTIYVTHDQVEAMTMGDRIAVMQDGVLQQCDTPMNLFNSPSNVFVAGFIGTPSMNFVTAKVVKSNAGVRVETATFALKIPDRLSDTVISRWLEKEVLVGIRPSDLFDSTMSGHLQPAEHNTIAAVVDVTEPMGDVSTVYLRAGEHQLVATFPGDTRVKDGDEITVLADTNRLRLFDPESEAAIA